MPGARTIAGRYRCTELLGSGGMADVFRAHDELLERDVAVKLLRATSTDDVARARFAAEARTLASLHHPNLVLVLDAGNDSDVPYLVMELVDGPTLGQRLRDRGPLSVEDAAVLGGQLADGLARAHAHGIVHRDVKPGNILVRSTGQAVLADFGIARLLGARTELTNAGEVIGSPAYLAPEQVSGAEAGSPVDIYSLGLVLLEAVTGQRTYAGTPIEAALARLSMPPTIPVSLGAGLVGLLTAMTALDPSVRPTADEVREKLAELVLPASPVAAPLPATGTQPLALPDPDDATLVGLPVPHDEAPSRRRRGPLLAACGAVAAVVLAATALTTQLGSEEVAADPAPSPSASPSPTARATPAASPSPTPARTESVAVKKPATVRPSKKADAAQKKPKKAHGKGKGRR